MAYCPECGNRMMLVDYDMHECPQCDQGEELPLVDDEPADIDGDFGFDTYAGGPEQDDHPEDIYGGWCEDHLSYEFDG